MIEGELVTAIRTLAARGVGKKAIAREIGVAVNTVRRYLRDPITPGQQIRPAARRLTDDHRDQARTLYEGPAAGNAVVVQRLLAQRGCAMSVRTIERAVVDIRRAQRVAALATVRVETAPGDQLQIDFGQKRLLIAGARVRIFLLVAVLSYSRGSNSLLQHYVVDCRHALSDPVPSRTSNHANAVEQRAVLHSDAA